MGEYDFKTQLRFIRMCEEAHSLLNQTGNLSVIGLETVDSLAERLPPTLCRVWQSEEFEKLSLSEQYSPFDKFVLCLKKSKRHVIRLAERQESEPRRVEKEFYYAETNSNRLVPMLRVLTTLPGKITQNETLEERNPH